MTCLHEALTTTEVQPGYCHCGCGGRTEIAKTSDLASGRIKGEALRYVQGHHRRKTQRYAVAPTGYTTSCWIWQLAKTRNGYGFVREPHGGMVYAHRYYYEQARGPIPANRQVDHLCRVRACVNPDHLELVAARENIRRGNGTRLTIEAVEKIRASSEKQAVLADRYGVSQSHISAIKSWRTWR
jgi:hypothetical protein